MKAPDSSSNLIVTITDSNFLIGVFVLLLSLRRHGVTAPVNVLGIDLSPDEKQQLEQFDGVRVVDADLGLPLAPTARKGEALMTAEPGRHDFVTLLDGDCIVTGDISRYLRYDEPALYVGMRSGDEDAWIFGSRYELEEPRQGIPRRVLEQWRRDVGERPQSRLVNTLRGGNLTVHVQYMPFVRRWHDQMLKVLPGLRGTHSRESLAYSQMDEWVLTSLVAFSFSPPPIRRVRLDLDTSAFVAHLGPGDPKPWVLWRWDRLKYLDEIVSLVEWGCRQGYCMGRVPWTFRRSLKPLIICTSALFHAFDQLRGRLVGSLRRLRWGRRLLQVLREGRATVSPILSRRAARPGGRAASVRG